jgi:hypothetical protein
MNKVIRWSLIVLGIVAAVTVLSGLYTTIQLKIAHSKGAYASPEQGMMALVNEYYPPEREVKILYAGINSSNGSQPFVWYVIAEVHAQTRADGSELGSNGCDAPGSYFLQTKDGSWVNVSEQSLPEFMGFWMEVFNMNGPGQTTPSTNWPDGQPNEFCR